MSPHIVETCATWVAVHPMGNIVEVGAGDNIVDGYHGGFVVPIQDSNRPPVRRISDEWFSFEEGF